MGYVATRCLMVILTPIVGACSASWATRQSVEYPQTGTAPVRIYDVAIEPCADRTAGVSGHDLSQEATNALTAAVTKSKWLRMRDDAPYRLTCDVERFVPGSAGKRWLMPGWGSTVADVAVMVWDAKKQSVITTVRSQATVAVGGLYTVDAEQSILKLAFEDGLRKLEKWAGTAKESAN